MFYLVLPWASNVHAQSTGYVYDANGRVVATTGHNGTSEQYSYNALGHVSQVSAPIAAGQMAIFAFMPTHGETGSQVIIQGQGFDSSAANDTVSFNGTAATVLSASATQLVTLVPSGATTGLISVTVGSQTAASAAPFVIDNTGLPPTITQVSPLLVSQGGTVTITGAHLNPAAGNTTVQMGGRVISSLAAISDAQLQYTVPSDGVSGYVAVATPYGAATSTVPVTVLPLPSGVSASSVVSSGYAPDNGAGVSLNIGASGQIGAVTFTASQSGWISLQASAITTTAGSISYTVYGPGNVMVQQGSISASSPSIHLPQLTPGDNYLALFQPNGAGAQLTISAQVDATLTSGVQASTVTTVAGQSQRMLFSAAAGAAGDLELELTNVNVTGGSQNQVNVQIFNAAGGSITSFSCTGSSTANYCHQPLWNMAAGTYSIIVSPSSGGTVAFNTLEQPDVIGPALTANTPLDVSMSVGQMERVTFNATAGQTVALSLANVNTGTTGQPMYALVFAPGAVNWGGYYTYIDTTSSATLNLPNLPASGTYTVVLGTGYSVPGSVQVTLVPGISGAMPSDGTTESYTTTASGQSVYLSFTANSGDNLELELTNVNVTGGSQNQVNVQIFNATGGYVTSFSCTGSASSPNYCHQPLWNMAAGTYSMVVSPSSAGTMAFNAILQPDVIGPALTGNTPLNVSMSAGQMERVTFNGTAGQALRLSIANVSTTPAGQFLAVFVFRPDTSPIVMSNNFVFETSTSSGTFNLPSLPVSGTYTVVIGSGYSVPVSGQVTLISQ
ncbi:IPT/TIG domain-containing protein [Burkholderia ubonensis]|uniref:IPT/TIG domain-containing protein n=1 Tax=Burkholderia ubonensis TaxID=101571 RepID=UPI001E506A79|nr:IPT/TIG domain-containing protein [Burkholderia ubonensis]